jgi:oxaloacetate decarboxylase alpha subunit
MKKIKINDLTIRDIFQNIDSGYISEKLLNRIIEHLGKVKFDSLEVFGGSAFEKMLGNIFQKSPFEIVYSIKNKIPKIPLQALIGARNLVGMEIYPRSVIKKFISECRKSGVDRFKVFDSLNDIENFKFTVSTITENGGLCQGTIIYDDLKDLDFYVDFSDELTKCGCRSICIKDTESTLLPQRATELFKKLSENISTPLYLSVYNLRGLQISNYYNASAAGCSGVDMSFIPSSYNDLTPTIFPFFLSLKDTDISIGLDYLKLLEIFEWFKKNIYPTIRNELLYSKFLFSNKNQNLLPKWLLTSINNQLTEIGENNKIDIVLDEVFRIKNEIGKPSLSVPIGQIVGSQAIINTIISDRRWEIINSDIQNLITGYYGRLPRDADPELLKRINREEGKSGKIIKKDKKVAGPGETVEDKTLDQCASEIKNLTKKDDYIMSYLFFPEKTLKLLENKKTKKPEKTDRKVFTEDSEEISFPELLESGQKPVKFDDIDLKKIKEITNLVETSDIDGIKLEIDGVKISINKKIDRQKDTGEPPEQKQKEKAPVQDEAQDENLILVKSPIVGTFYSASSPDEDPFVKVGSRVKKGDTLCIIEAMKLMNKINAENAGEIIEILVRNEETVEYDQVIMKIKNV